MNDSTSALRARRAAQRDRQYHHQTRFAKRVTATASDRTLPQSERDRARRLAAEAWHNDAFWQDANVAAEYMLVLRHPHITARTSTTPRSRSSHGRRRGHRSSARSGDSGDAGSEGADDDQPATRLPVGGAA